MQRGYAVRPYQTWQGQSPFNHVLKRNLYVAGQSITAAGYLANYPIAPFVRPGLGDDDHRTGLEFTQIGEWEGCPYYVSNHLPISLASECRALSLSRPATLRLPVC